MTAEEEIIITGTQKTDGIGRAAGVHTTIHVFRTIALFTVITFAFLVMPIAGSRVEAKSKFTVVLDPGHGGTDSGATAFGTEEKNLNLKIAQYCKAKLEEGGDITVYLTRNDDTYVSLTDRVNIARNYGADLFVCIHNNASESSAPRGLEVYYPNENYNIYCNRSGKQVATMISNQLAGLGIPNNGIKTRDYPNGECRYPDGSIADYYSVIRNSKVDKTPSVIVEHAYLTNATDYGSYLNEDWKLEALGNADAAGIRQYFNEVWDISSQLAPDRTDANAIFRMYNPLSGEHLFTGDANEVETIRHGEWVYEGKAWYSPSTPENQTMPVYRLYNKYSGDHHYTMDTNEVNVLTSQDGWVSEGIFFYSNPNNAIPVYRLFNPKATFATHLYTTDAHEADVLASQNGWINEGIGWYGSN